MSTGERVDFLKTAFGQHAAEFDDNLNQMAKVAYDAYSHKVQLSKPVYKARSDLAKKVKGFWFNALKNCRATAPFIDTVDEQALQHLEDVTIEHEDKDVRNWEITLTFSSKNPSFKQTKLSRKFTVSPPKSMTEDLEDYSAPPPFNLEADLFLLPCERPQWTSPEHDLCKKAPRPDIKAMEEFDEFEGQGSFFHLFADVADGIDEIDVGETLLEWYAHATEYAGGLTNLDDVDSDGAFDFDDDDDDESDEEDPTKEIDLGSDEESVKRPKKRSKKD